MADRDAESAALHFRFHLLAIPALPKVICYHAFPVSQHLSLRVTRVLIQLHHSSSLGVAKRAAQLLRNLHRRRLRLHPMEESEILRVEGLKKVFRSGNSDLVLFENLSFQVRKGEMLAIVGESGSGKSTLLHILGALDSASEGDVYFANLKLRNSAEDARPSFATASSVSSGSFIICCRNSPQSRMSPCRCCCGALARRASRGAKPVSGCRKSV